MHRFKCQRVRVIASVPATSAGYVPSDMIRVVCSQKEDRRLAGQFWKTVILLVQNKGETLRLRGRRRRFLRALLGNTPTGKFQVHVQTVSELVAVIQHAEHGRNYKLASKQVRQDGRQKLLLGDHPEAEILACFFSLAAFLQAILARMLVKVSATNGANFIGTVPHAIFEVLTLKAAAPPSAHLTCHSMLSRGPCACSGPACRDRNG